MWNQFMGPFEAGFGLDTCCRDGDKAVVSTEHQMLWHVVCAKIYFATNYLVV